jgi:hypothetical protein
MPSEMSKKALSQGLITQKQYDKLPSHLLEAVVKSKMKGAKNVKKNKAIQDDKSKPAPKGKVKVMYKKVQYTIPASVVKGKKGKVRSGAIKKFIDDIETKNKKGKKTKK